MGKDPSFQFYPGDWTRDLDDQPLWLEGAWIRICCRLWWSTTKGEATKTLQEWADVLRKSKKKSTKIIQSLNEKGIASVQFLDNQNVTIISRRMKRDWEIRQMRKVVGKMGGNPVLVKSVDNLLNQTSNQNPPSSSSTSSSKNKKKKIKSYFVLPEWVPKKEWEGFVEFRKKKGAFTDRAKELTIIELEKLKAQGNDPAAVLNQSVQREWKGVFEVKQAQGGNGSGTYQRVNAYGRPIPRQAWEDEAERITREWEQQKALEAAAGRETGKEP